MPTFRAEKVDVAIEKGLNALNLMKEDVDILVLQTEKKGFFGFGKQEAIVSIEKKSISIIKDEETRLKDLNLQSNLESVDSDQSENDSETFDEEPSDQDAVHQVAKYLKDIVESMGIHADVEVILNQSFVFFNLETNENGALIGKNGKVINAIQYLAQSMLNKVSSEKFEVVVNIGNYRERRYAMIERIASDSIKQVKKNRQPVFLEPMPSFERKQVHALVSKDMECCTYSEGKEPNRYLVIDLKK